MQALHCPPDDQVRSGPRFFLAQPGSDKLSPLNRAQGRSRAVVRVVNMHEAKTQLSRLVQAAAEGEPFIIARNGKPLVKVVSLDAAAGTAQRTGFLQGISVPPDFDRMGADQIERSFGGRL